MALILIIGGNRGIGLALAKLHRHRGDRVVVSCRRSSDALSALGVEVVDGIDVGSEAAPQQLAARIDSTIDRVYISAGVLSREHLDGLDGDACGRIEQQFRINALAPLRLVAALRARLGSGSKVGLLSSRMGSIGDNSSGGYYGYRMSKAALNAAGRSLAHDLRGQGIAVLLLHPGFVRTQMTAGQGEIEPEQAAQGLAARMDAFDLAHSGEFQHANGSLLPW